jgi:hypothetical protein
MTTKRKSLIIEAKHHLVPKGFVGGVLDGLSGATYVFAPTSISTMGRRYISRGIGGDWAAVGRDISAAELAYGAAQKVKERA